MVVGNRTLIWKAVRKLHHGGCQQTLRAAANNAEILMRVWK
jgi:hypothetical protein